MMKKMIGLPTQEGYDFIDSRKIVRCEAEGAYTCIHFTDRKKYIVSKNLKEFEVILDPTQFCRVHHSHLVNLEFVIKYYKGKGGVIELEDGVQIEVSVRKKNDFLDKYTLQKK